LSTGLSYIDDFFGGLRVVEVTMYYIWRAIQKTKLIQKFRKKLFT